MVCWQEPGLQRLAQPPGCFGDRIPITCHPRKICMSHSCPIFHFKRVPSPVCVRVCACVCLHLCIHSPVWAQSSKGADIHCCLFSRFFPHFSLCVLFFLEVGSNSPLIGLFTDKIIRITKMAEFSALSNRFNHEKPFVSLSLFLKPSFFSPPLSADGLKGCRVYPLSPRWLMPPLH